MQEGRYGVLGNYYFQSFGRWAKEKFIHITSIQRT